MEQKDKLGTTLHELARAAREIPADMAEHFAALCAKIEGLLLSAAKDGWYAMSCHVQTPVGKERLIINGLREYFRDHGIEAKVDTGHPAGKVVRYGDEFNCRVCEREVCCCSYCDNTLVFKWSPN